MCFTANELPHRVHEAKGRGVDFIGRIIEGNFRLMTGGDIVKVVF